MNELNHLKNVIVIEREFRAPRKLVWETFTNAEHIKNWFGPKGFSTRVEQHDFQVGGRSRFVMIGPDGKEYPSEGVYLEIIPYEKYVSTDEFGENFRPPKEMELPDGMVTTFLFSDVGRNTKVTISVAHPTEEDRKKHEEMGVVMGWNSSFDCLDDLLDILVEHPEREIIVSRLIHAPQELVFDAWTDVEHISNWWGPEGFTTTTHEAEFKSGGTWRFTMHGPDGREYPNKIVFDEFVRPERITYHHEGEDETNDVKFLSAVTFVNQEGNTLLTLRLIFESSKERDRTENEFGATDGGNQTLSRLAEIVEKLV